MSMQTLAMFVLVAFAVGGVAWVFIYPLLSGERQAEQRQESVTRDRAGRARAAQRATRRSRAASRSRKR